jgi:hypothetical protein
VFPLFNPTWPWWHTNIGHVGMDTRDPANPVVIPPYILPSAHMHDYMSYADDSGGPIPKWVSPYTYCELLDHFTNGADACPDAVKRAGSDETVELGETTPTAAWDWSGGDAADARLVAYRAPAAQALTAAVGAEQPYLLISGTVAWDGASGTIDPMETVQRSGPVPFEAAGDAFTLRVLDAGGAVLLRVPFTPVETHRVEGQAQGFGFLVPAPADAERVEILRGNTVIATRAASAHPPTISLSNDLVGRTADGPVQLSWQAADADGDPLIASVELSRDGGATWLPAAVGLTGSSATLDPANLPGGTAVQVRVDVSDGFRSASVVSGAFSIPAHAPSVSIVAPAADTTIAHDVPFALTAQAFDWEDGAVDGSRITWSSDRDGQLGSGSWILAEHLTVGTHVITATTVDADGMSGSATVQVTVTGSEGDAGDPAGAKGSGGGGMLVVAGAMAIGLALLAVAWFALRRRRTNPGTRSR